MLVEVVRLLGHGVKKVTALTLVQVEARGTSCYVIVCPLQSGHLQVEQIT